MTCAQINANNRESLRKHKKHDALLKIGMVMSDFKMLCLGFRILGLNTSLRYRDQGSVKSCSKQQELYKLKHHTDNRAQKINRDSKPIEGT
jgi:hypothetical protein